MQGSRISHAFPVTGHTFFQASTFCVTPGIPPYQQTNRLLLTIQNFMSIVGAWPRISVATHKSLLIAGCLLALTNFCFGQAGAAKLPDYGAQLQRVAAKNVAASLKEFHVEPGFVCLPIATEPAVADPVAIAFDADGAMFVVEMRGYSEDEELNLGRIRRLVDADDDGVFETSSIFADGLSWPTAVTCYKGGILVAAAPDLIYFKDTNNDGQADVKTKWFTGFQRSNVQGLVNSLQWGIDNRIHGATSSSGASIVRSDINEAQPLELRGRDFAIDPRRRTVFATSGGGQHGMSFNRWGEKFVCQNSNHVQQLVYEDRYLRRNPFAKPPSSRIGIATDGPQADVFRTSPVEAWRIIRTNLRVTGKVPGPVERGGKAAGYFTGATGILAFQGDRMPAEFLDHVFVCDVGSNLIHRKQLHDQGVHYAADRIDAQHEFVTSDDIWFRPVQLANGPEGVLYVIDMHREVVEHPASLPPVIKKHLDLTSGRNRGRIYVIAPESFAHRSPPRLSQSPTTELVRYLEHPNGWHRQTASRLLYERRDRSSIPEIRQLIRHSVLPEARQHGLYALAALDALSPEDLLVGLRDEDAHVRRHTVRLSESYLADAPGLWAPLLKTTQDVSPKVRYQLAFTLGELPNGPQRLEALQRLVEQDAESPYLLAAVQNSVADGAAPLFLSLVTSPQFSSTSSGLNFLQELASQIRRQQLPAEIPGVAKFVRDTADTAPLLVMRLLPELALPVTSNLAQQLLRDEKTATLATRARNMANDSDLDVAERTAAIGMLAVDSAQHAVPIYTDLLRPTQALPLQQAALDSIRHHAAPEIATVLLSGWDTFTPAVREEAANLLSMRSTWQDALLKAIEGGQVGLTDLTVSQRQRLEQRAPTDVWKRIQQAWGAKFATGDRAAVFAEYRQALGSATDLDAGRQVFRKVCAACHRVEYFGHNLAPSLTAMKNRGAESILVNVLEPNREVNPQYLAYTASLVDGRVISGMIKSETATSIELLEAENRSHTLLRVEIDELVNTRRSLMPTGMEKQISPREMSNLIAYLLSVDE